MSWTILVHPESSCCWIERDPVKLERHEPLVVVHESGIEDYMDAFNRATKLCEDQKLEFSYS